MNEAAVKESFSKYIAGQELNDVGFENVMYAFKSCGFTGKLGDVKLDNQWLTPDEQKIIVDSVINGDELYLTITEFIPRMIPDGDEVIEKTLGADLNPNVKLTVTDSSKKGEN